MPPKKTPPKDSAAEGKGSADKDASDPSFEQQMKDATRDAQLKFLQEQRGKSDINADTLTAQLDILLKEDPSHLPILQEKLKHAIAANAKDSKSSSEVSGLAAAIPVQAR